MNFTLSQSFLYVSVILHEFPLAIRLCIFLYIVLHTKSYKKMDIFEHQVMLAWMGNLTSEGWFKVPSGQGCLSLRTASSHMPTNGKRNMLKLKKTSTQLWVVVFSTFIIKLQHWNFSKCFKRFVGVFWYPVHNKLNSWNQSSSHANHLHLGRRGLCGRCPRLYDWLGKMVLEFELFE